MEELLILIHNIILEIFFNILAIFPWELPLYKGEKKMAIIQSLDAYILPYSVFL